MLEDRVPVAVQGQRDSVALDQALHEKEVAAGVLLLVEQRVSPNPPKDVLWDSP